MQKVWLIAGFTLLAACASEPKPVGGPIEGSPHIREVIAQPETFRGQRVRWGGVIVSVQNQPKDTLIEVVSRELDEQGKPKGSEVGGRFLAQVPGFLDPEAYARGRLLTVTGMIDSPITRNIGDYPYRYPLVKVDRHHLWPPQPRFSNPAAARAYYYDPLWDPWYPFYRPWPRGPYWPYW